MATLKGKRLVKLGVIDDVADFTEADFFKSLVVFDF